jgi:hypothetical protein
MESEEGMKTLAQSIEEFNAQVIPRSANPFQRTDMKMAFLAGASEMWDYMMGVAEMDEEVAHVFMKEMETELTDLKKQMLAEYPE